MGLVTLVSGDGGLVCLVHDDAEEVHSLSVASQFKNEVGNPPYTYTSASSKPLRHSDSPGWRSKVAWQTHTYTVPFTTSLLSCSFFVTVHLPLHKQCRVSNSSLISRMGI